MWSLLEQSSRGSNGDGMDIYEGWTNEDTLPSYTSGDRKVEDLGKKSKKMEGWTVG